MMPLVCRAVMTLCHSTVEGSVRRFAPLSLCIVLNVVLTLYVRPILGATNQWQNLESQLSIIAHESVALGSEAGLAHFSLPRLATPLGPHHSNLTSRASYLPLDLLTTVAPKRAALGNRGGRSLAKASSLPLAPATSPHSVYTRVVDATLASTPFASFSSAITSSFALTLFTEFGDRTFFIASILALRHSRAMVFLGASAALVIQSFFSTIAGQLLHFLPNNEATKSLIALPLDDYAAALFLFVFGVLHLRAAYKDESNPPEDVSSYCEDDATGSDNTMDLKRASESNASTTVGLGAGTVTSSNTTDSYVAFDDANTILPGGSPVEVMFQNPTMSFCGGGGGLGSRAALADVDWCVLTSEPCRAAEKEVSTSSTCLDKSSLISEETLQLAPAPPATTGKAASESRQLCLPNELPTALAHVNSRHCRDHYFFRQLAESHRQSEIPALDSRSVFGAATPANVPFLGSQSINNEDECFALSVSSTSPPAPQIALRRLSMTRRFSASSRQYKLGSTPTKNVEYLEAEKATEHLTMAGFEPAGLQIIRETFWVIFAAEFGDKSMVSTVALAAAQNPVGVFAGSIFAHVAVTGVAVLAGYFLGGYISEKLANLCGAALFFTFGTMAIIEGLARQGFMTWWSFGEKTSSFLLAVSLKSLKDVHSSGGAVTASATPPVSGALLSTT